jgi:endonuclease/exonuclease/phosphatase family metal-dependent hydrolase
VTETFTAATLNIWNRFGPWEERLPAIRAHLARLRPDVIGLQEVLHSAHGDALDQAKAVAEGLGYHVAYGVASQAHGVSFGNAILSRWPILRTENFPLPNGGTDEQRAIVFAEIEAPFDTVPFFCTHLNWKLHEGHVRCEQVRALTEIVARKAPISGFPPVVVGDFNAEPDSDEIRFMRGLTGLGGKCVYYADCFDVAGQGDGTTFARRNPFAYLCHEPDRRIDYVFVRGPDDRYRGEPLAARVCFDEEVDGVFPSDHFGVIATISR